MEIQQLVHNQAPWISRYVSHFVGYVKWGPVQFLPRILSQLLDLKKPAAHDHLVGSPRRLPDAVARLRHAMGVRHGLLS